MTNRLALALAILICLALAGDFFLNDGAASYILSRKFLTFIDWIAFWR